MKRRSLLLISVLAAVLACSTHVEKTVPSSDETYTTARIQELARTDYDAAMQLTEDGLRSGQLSAFTANTTRAQITYLYTEDYSAAAEYMQKALKQEEAQDPATRSELIYRLATILKSGKDFTALLSACTEGKEFARMAGKSFLEASFDFLAGDCLFDMDEDTGLEMIQGAIKKASAIASSEEDFGHLLFFYGEYLNSLVGDGQYKAALEESDNYDALIGKMEKKFPQGDASYIDRCRFYQEIRRAICYTKLGNQKAAADTFEKAKSRKAAGTTGGKTLIVSYYSVSGQPDKILAIYRDELPYTGADTVSRAYRMRLARLRDAYENAGLTAKAREYEARYDSLNKQIEEKEIEEGTMVNAARYNAQRYRFQLEDTNNALQKNKWLLVTIVFVLILAICILLSMNEKRARLHSEETESLEKSLRSIQRQVAVIAERASPKDAPQQTLEKLIEGKQLYLDKNLNRESAAALLGIPSNEISRMLNDIEPGISFPDYIKSLRIRHALELIGQNPDISVSELADRCGFYTVRTLQRSFLAVTGKTPSEYAKALKK